MWRKVVTQPVAEQPMTQPTLPTVERVAQQDRAQPQDLAQLLLPRPRRTRSLRFLSSFWAPTSPGSTTRAASFFQHVSATTWLRAS
jgi:hypothetical protein